MAASLEMPWDLASVTESTRSQGNVMEAESCQGKLVIAVFVSGTKGGRLACKKMGGWWRWALLSPDGVAPSRMVVVSASVNLPLHHEVRKFSSGTGSPGCFRKKGHKTVVVWWWCLGLHQFLLDCCRLVLTVFKDFADLVY